MNTWINTYKFAIITILLTLGIAANLYSSNPKPCYIPDYCNWTGCEVDENVGYYTQCGTREDPNSTSGSPYMLTIGCNIKTEDSGVNFFSVALECGRLYIDFDDEIGSCNKVMGTQCGGYKADPCGT